MNWTAENQKAVGVAADAILEARWPGVWASREDGYVAIKGGDYGIVIACLHEQRAKEGD